MLSRLTCLLLLTCLPALSFAGESEILDVSENALLIEEVNLQVGDPAPTPSATPEAGTETFGVSDSTGLIEDVKLQTGDPLSTQDMVAAGQDSLATLRERINTAYEVNAEDLSSDSKALLRKSQIAWETFAETTCQAESEREAGSLKAVINISCQVRETQRRLDWLETP